MNKPAYRFVPRHFALLPWFAVTELIAVGGCTRTDSVGSAGQEDASYAGSSDGLPTSNPGTGGAQVGGLGTGGITNAGTGGSLGGDGGATRFVSCTEGPVTGDRCAAFPAGKVCRLGESCLYGCSLDCSCRDGFWACESVCRDCWSSLRPDAAWPAPGKPPLVCSVFCDYEPRSIDALPPSDDGPNQGGPDAREVPPGDGIARLSPRTPYLDLGTIDLKTGGTITVQITNHGDIGTGPVTVVAGAGLSVAGCSSPLAPGESCVLSIAALPTATGPFNGLVTISANPGTMTRAEISVRATVVDSVIVTGKECSSADACGAGYTCDTDQPGGYCLPGLPDSKSPRACGTPESVPCPEGTLCSPRPWSTIPGICMRACSVNGDCRAGYRCDYVELFPGEPNSPRSPGRVCWP